MAFISGLSDLRSVILAFGYRFDKEIGITRLRVDDYFKLGEWKLHWKTRSNEWETVKRPSATIKDVTAPDDYRAHCGSSAFWEYPDRQGCT